MSSAAAPADVKDDLLLRIRRLLGKNKPELQTEWKEMDCSDFEPVAKADLLAALLLRLFRDTNDSDSAQSQPSCSRSPVVSATDTPAPVKSFKEAVTSPARLPAPSFDSSNFEKRLAKAELFHKELKQRFRDMDRQAEALDRETRKLNLVVYNVPEETKEDREDQVETFCSLLDKCMPDGREVEGLGWEQEKIGTYCSAQKRPRPVRLIFATMSDKHVFLKHAKHLKEVGLRYDDDLTRLQQKQREDMSADFSTLKSKGHKPFYRGSSLKFRHAEKTHTCKRDKANRVPDVPA